MQVLLCLACRQGELVTREELLAGVWGERAVSDEPLTRCIAELRKALGETQEERTYIETVPKRGYQLIAPVDGFDDKKSESRPGGRKLWPVASLFILAIVILTGWWLQFGRENEDASSGPARPGTTVAGAAPSIVVIPFSNIGPDESQAYFVDGVSEELINLLAGIPGLRVISRRSAFSFRDSDANIQAIAAQLDVTHVLEGSVRRSGEDVRISVHLVDADSDSHVWSATYERRLEDIFDTQEEIAARVAAELRITLLGEPPSVSAENPDAYARVLQARFLSDQLEPEAMERAAVLFRDALAIDPEYADAWVGLAYLYTRQVGQGILPMNTGYDMARSAAETALDIAPETASALRILGWIAHVHDKDIEAAARYYERAIRIDPTRVSGAAQLAAGLGRLDQAIALQEYDRSRDPVSAVSTNNLGLYYQRAGRFEDAIRTLQMTLVLSPGYVGAHYFLGTSLLLNGEYESALEEMQKESFEVYRLLGLVTANHALGDPERSDGALQALVEKYESEWAYNIAYVLAYRGEADRAFQWLEKAVEYNDPGLAEIATQPLFRNIETDPRWLPFLERIGRSPEQLAAIRLDIPVP
jgi:TolB-like protein/Tfp pilus assembly protein PilF